ncbi:hypothetical protein GCM10010442_16300 [Kitasatospora kifunensis]
MPGPIAEPWPGRRALAQLAEAARDRQVAWLFTEAPGLLARTVLTTPVLTAPAVTAPAVTAPALTGALRDVGELYAAGVSLREGVGRRTKFSRWPIRISLGWHQRALRVTTSAGRWLMDCTNCLHENSDNGRTRPDGHPKVRQAG